MNRMDKLIALAAAMPKAELHIHIEGSLEPELMFRLAARNHMDLPYTSIDELKEAYRFDNLQSFLDIYYDGASVLQRESDFYDLTWAYLKKCKDENIRHTEIFFDPQTHTQRGIAFDTVIKGIHRALEMAWQEWGISSKLIPCFLRHLSEEDAILTFREALNYKEWIDGFGLDSSEQNFPPSGFQNVFARVRTEGLYCVAHAGEEGPAVYVREALDLLKINRIDHGNNALDDPELVERIVKEKIGLTVCPLSNFALKVTPDLSKHPLKKMLSAALKVCINSDDPAYFGGYLNQNFETMIRHLDLNAGDIYRLARNSFEISFASEERKISLISELDDYFIRKGYHASLR